MRVAPVASITRRSKPSAAPRGRRHLREGGDEVVVDRIAFAVATLLFIHLGLEAPPLLGGVRQLAEGIGQFHAAGVELEPIGDARVAGVGPCQGRQLGRVRSRMVARPLPRHGSTLVQQDAAERVLPGIILGHAHADGGGRRGECGRIRAATSERRQQVDARVAAKGLGHAEAIGAAKGSAVRAP